MKRTSAWLLRVSLPGTWITLGEAVGRFGWTGLHTGLPFPPETLSQWFFSVLPMRLFSLGIGLFGESAKWYTLAAMIALWSLFVGAAMFVTHRLVRTVLQSRRWNGRKTSSSWREIVATAALSFLLIEGAWAGSSPPVRPEPHVWAMLAGMIPLMGAYLFAAWWHHARSERATHPRESPGYL